MCQDLHLLPTCQKARSPHLRVKQCLSVSKGLRWDVLVGSCRVRRMEGEGKVYWEFWKMSRYFAGSQWWRKGSADKGTQWTKTRRWDQADVLREITRRSVVVKAQSVRARDGLRGFLTFTKDLNYAQLCLLHGFTWALPPLWVLLLSSLLQMQTLSLTVVKWELPKVMQLKSDLKAGSVRWQSQASLTLCHYFRCCDPTFIPSTNIVETCKMQASF